MIKNTSITLLVGAGPISEYCLLETKTIADTIVAVDGGYNYLQRFRIKPDIVLGDFDSIHDQSLTDSANFIHQLDQNNSDFDKALNHCYDSFFLGLGFLGGRHDHTIYNLYKVANLSQLRIILIDENDTVCRIQDTMELTLPRGSRLSLMPVPEMTLTIQGVVWPLTRFEMNTQIGASLSNEVKGDRVHIECHKGQGLLITECRLWQKVMAAVSVHPA